MNAQIIKQLTEVGFLAASHGNLRQAQPIFEALIQIRATRAFPHVGLAIALLNASRPESALEQLDQGLRMTPPQEHPELYVIRSLALRALGRFSECGSDLIKANDHPAARSMLGLPQLQTSTTRA
jgi:tetratricopeptide (TPR) repeat protein